MKFILTLILSILPLEVYAITSTALKPLKLDAVRKGGYLLDSGISNKIRCGWQKGQTSNLIWGSECQNVLTSYKVCPSYLSPKLVVSAVSASKCDSGGFKAIFLGQPDLVLHYGAYHVPYYVMDFKTHKVQARAFFNNCNDQMVYIIWQVFCM